MLIIKPVRGFFHRHAAKILDNQAARLQLVNRRQVSQQGHFVFPGIDYLDDIQIGRNHVGYVNYCINPLGDRLYINMIEIIPALQGNGIGLGALWHLWCKHRLPIVPLYQYNSSDMFWRRARRRFAAANAVITEDLCSTRDLELEKQRWQHLVPEHLHERLILDLKTSPEWPKIQARFESWKDL
ncbi:N-acetyltransferase [Pseudomonas orientalis]|uniref:N-acetyltransferase n=1 Tax=Pseudomonas orientalis TaxID=76758 RepID=UPI003986BA83